MQSLVLLQPDKFQVSELTKSESVFNYFSFLSFLLKNFEQFGNT